MYLPVKWVGGGGQLLMSTPVLLCTGPTCVSTCEVGWGGGQVLMSTPVLLCTGPTCISTCEAGGGGGGGRY